MTSRLINLYGAPSSGKSTLAAKLFSEIKQAGHETELVTEHAKEWVWDDRKINSFDQIKIISEQIYRETRLFNKVDYIITDSPSPLGCFYEEYFFNTKMIRPMLIEYLKERSKIVETYDFFISYDESKASEKHRYHNKIESKLINKMMPNWLKEFNIEVKYIDLNFSIF